MLSNVRMIEIELHSYCNRTCHWCPNSFIDRKHYQELKGTVFVRLLNELRKENFKGTISFSRYNEPLYNMALFHNRVEQTRTFLPDCKIVTNTNGDYLNPATLYDLDVDELTIGDYSGKGADYCWSRLVQLGATPLKMHDTFIEAEYFDMKIRYDFDWQDHAQIIDRGGSLEGDFNWKNDRCKRDYPCFEPKYFIGVDYDGSVTPCCNIRHDNTDHKFMILGNLQQMSLVDIYYSSKAMQLRRMIADGELPSPCFTCHKEAGRYTRRDSGIFK